MWKVAVLLVVLVVVHGNHATAQAPLFLANEETTIRGISFKFANTQTFEEETLLEQIATQEPGFMDRVRRILPFVDARTYPLDPIEVQRDVVRLRRYYRQHGFLDPWVEYGASQLDTTSNSIRIIFSVTEGPPLIIQDVSFFAPGGGYASSLFEGAMRDNWIRFRDRTTFRTGDRYTEFDRLRIQDQVLTWFQDRGYAFARFDTVDVQIDSTAYTADIGFYVNPGPLGYFSEILIEGNEEVGRNIILRELPFSVGDRFSQSELIEGQRELFGLNLFRVALADVPPTYDAEGPEVDSLEALAETDPDAELRQPRDSTVLVRFRVREARLRYLRAQTGYARDLGLTLQGQWTHRNFFGGARNLTVSGVINSGLLASPPVGTIERRVLRGEVSLRQPYLFTTSLSGTITPFVQYERNPLLEDTDQLDVLGVNMNSREFGVTSTLVYQLLPFRTLSFQYSISRAAQAEPQVDVTLPSDSTDAFSKSEMTLNATLGRVNNFFNPRRGFLVRPFVAQAGQVLRSDIEYIKAGGEIVGYLPITRRIHLGGRLAGGRLWPIGESQAELTDPVIENRFDPIRFYTGGSDDVRGWANQLLGPKFPRPQTRLTTDEVTGEPIIEIIDYYYESIGGRAKLAGNIELRLPFPGLGNAWRSAIFLDFGQVSSERHFDEETLTATVTDNGKLRLNPSAFRYGAGAGVRYETPVGYIRLDLAFKLNPSDLDLQNPQERYEYEQGLGDEPEKQQFLGRFNVHLSLGQAF